jgi:membrane protein YdbS with pleckstrin-like domain
MALYYARRTRQLKMKKALYGVMAGYLCLLIPTTTVNILYPETIHGIPSIMCGFAVLLALILTLYVLPYVTTKKRRK